MNGGSNQRTGGGCLALVVLAVVVGAIAAAVISLAALIDPFNWMPRVGEIWANCEGDCALAHRFPGFWWHAVANLIYAAVAIVAVCAFGLSVLELREKRVERYDRLDAAAAHKAARDHSVATGVTLEAVALLPIVVAIA